MTLLIFSKICIINLLLNSLQYIDWSHDDWSRNLLNLSLQLVEIL